MLTNKGKRLHGNLPVRSCLLRYVLQHMSLESVSEGIAPISFAFKDFIFFASGILRSQVPNASNLSPQLSSLIGWKTLGTRTLQFTSANLICLFVEVSSNQL